MSSKHIVIANVLILLIAVSSCSPVLFATMQPNTPLPKEKGELAAGIGPTFYSSAYAGNFGFSTTGSYAFSNKYFVSANYLGWWLNLEDDDEGLIDLDEWDSDAHLFEVGIGRYGVNQYDSRWRSEVTIGYGMGYINNEREDFVFANSRFSNLFLQPALGYKSEHLWICASIKFNYIMFQSIDREYPDPMSNRKIDSFYLENRQKLAAEPGINVSLYFRPVSLSVRYSFSSFKSDMLASGQLPGIMNKNLSVSAQIQLNLRKNN